MPVYQPNQPQFYPEPSPENGGYKMLNVIMSANIRGAGEYENIAFENEENLKAFLYSNLAYKADAAKDLEGLLKIIPELKVDPSQAEERRRMSELARKNISDVAARKYFSSAGYGKDREMRILMSYDSSPAGREANAKLFNTIMNGSPEERGKLIEKRIKDAMELFNYVMNGNPTDAYLVENFEQLFALQELATSAQMIRDDANRTDISRPFVLSQEAIDSLNILERYSPDVEMKAQRVKMISNADYEHLNLPYLLTCDGSVFKKLEKFVGSDVNDEMGENTKQKGSLTQLDFHTTTDWSRKLLCGQRQKHLMYAIEDDFGDDKEKVTIKIAGDKGDILESPYTLSGAHNDQIVANNMERGYALVTSPTGEAICYRLNLDGSIRKAKAAEMLSDMPFDNEDMLQQMRDANKGFFIGSKEYSTALKNMEKAFATVRELGNPPSVEKMDAAASYYKAILEKAEKYIEKKLSAPPTRAQRKMLEQLVDYKFGPDDIIEDMSPREKLRFDTMKQATIFCKKQLALLEVQKVATAAELKCALGGERKIEIVKSADVFAKAGAEYSGLTTEKGVTSAIRESDVGNIADELRADINKRLERVLTIKNFDKDEARETFSDMVLLEIVKRGRGADDFGRPVAGDVEKALAAKPGIVARAFRENSYIRAVTENLDVDMLRHFVMTDRAKEVAEKMTQFAEKMYAPKEENKELQMQNEQQIQKNEPAAPVH
jgi:hypothetical protein